MPTDIDVQHDGTGAARIGHLRHLERGAGGQAPLGGQRGQLGERLDRQVGEELRRREERHVVGHGQARYTLPPPDVPWRGRPGCRRRFGGATPSRRPCGPAARSRLPSAP